MDKDIFHPRFGSELGHGDELILVRMDSAIRDQADEMESARFGFFQSLFENFVFCEAAIGNGFVDAREILVNDATRAEIEVTYLGISHLSLGEADIHTGSGEEAVGILGKDFVGERSVRENDSITVFDSGFFAAWVGSPTVTND